jgi:RNA polymerase subunit RPABC4/transcription elongation factor Spt4
MIRLTNAQLDSIKKKLIKDQNGVCPLCNRDMTRFDNYNIVVDHDHATGVVRAALCRNCNGIEGRIKRLAIMCSNGKTYMNWIIRLAHYYHNHREPQTKYIHPEHKTDYEKRMLKNKKARAAYAKKRMKELKKRGKPK